MNDLVVGLRRAAERVGSTGALNYECSFQLHDLPCMGLSSVAEIVQAALGDEAVVGGQRSVAQAEVLQDLREALEFRGDPGAHPNLAGVDELRESGEVERLVELARDLTADADLVFDVWLQAGDPLYPVFWEFRFVIIHGERAVVFLGAGSD